MKIVIGKVRGVVLEINFDFIFLVFKIEKIYFSCLRNLDCVVLLWNIL